MASIRRGVLAFCTALCMVGCGFGGAPDSISLSDAAFAKQIYGDLRSNNWTAIKAIADTNLGKQDLRSFVATASSYIPRDPPKSERVVHWGTRNNFRNGQMTYQGSSVTFEYEYSDRWIEAYATWRVVDGNRVLEGFGVYPHSAPLDVINRFSLSDKSFRHLVIFVSAIAMPVFSLFAFVVCLRTPMTRKRKILWAIFTLIGVGQVSLDWTSGQYSFHPANFMLFSSGFFRADAFSPYVISVTIPLGAIIFLVRRHAGRFLLQRPANPVPPQAVEDGLPPG